MPFIEQIADGARYDENEDSGVDALIDYKNALEDEVASVDSLVIAYRAGEMDCLDLGRALVTRGYGYGDEVQP
jgi:hypothetical protein